MNSAFLTHLLDFPSLFLVFHDLPLQTFRPLPFLLSFRVFLSLEFLLNTLLPLFDFLQKLYPRVDPILMLVAFVETPDRDAERVVDELNRCRTLVPALPAVAAAENEVFSDVIRMQIDRSGALGEVRWKLFGERHGAHCIRKRRRSFFPIASS